MRAGGGRSYPGAVQATRPDPARWTWYAVDPRLPDRYREWVLHDDTERTDCYNAAYRDTR